MGTKPKKTRTAQLPKPLTSRLPGQGGSQAGCPHGGSASWKGDLTDKSPYRVLDKSAFLTCLPAEQIDLSVTLSDKQLPGHVSPRDMSSSRTGQPPHGMASRTGQPKEPSGH